MSESKKHYKPIPVFATEMEEILFWDQADFAEYFDFDHPTDIVFKRIQRRKKKMMSVRIEEDMQAELKAVAAEHGVPYQKLMREFIYEGLLKLRYRKAYEAHQAALKAKRAPKPAPKRSAGRRVKAAAVT